MDKSTFNHLVSSGNFDAIYSAIEELVVNEAHLIEMRQKSADYYCAERSRRQAIQVDCLAKDKVISSLASSVVRLHINYAITNSGLDNPELCLALVFANNDVKSVWYQHEKTKKDIRQHSQD